MLSLPTQSSPYLVIIDILIIFITYITLKGALKSPYIINKSKYYFAVFLCVVFCLFPFWGSDWFHYLMFFPLMQKDYELNIEDVYFWIAQNLSPNYLIFRLIIWGGAFCLYLRIINQINVSRYLALLFFGTIYILWFSYARVSLSMAIAYFGLLLMTGNKRPNVLYFIIGILVTGCAYFFHKSAAFGIAMVLVSLILNSNIKWGIRLCIILFPILIVILRSYMGQILYADSSITDETTMQYMQIGQRYAAAEFVDRGVGQSMAFIFEVIPYYLVAYLGIKIFTSHIGKIIPLNVRPFILLQISIVIFSSAFLFMSEINTQTIYLRFLRFGAVPTSIVMAYMYQNRMYPKLTRISILIAICGSIYSLLYSVYTSSLIHDSNIL